MRIHFLLVYILSAINAKSSAFNFDYNVQDQNYIDFGNCSDKMVKYVNPCLIEAGQPWGIVGNFNSTLHKPQQFCCGIWDFMYCLIKIARDECSSDELAYIIDSSIANQTSFEVVLCDSYPRGSWFDCGLIWYDMLVLVILAGAAVVAMIMLVVNSCNRSDIPKPEKFEIVKVYI